MRSPRPRFTLRVTIALILAIGVALGWIAHRARVQREAVEAIIRAGGEVTYDYQVPNYNAGPRGPEWLRGLIGRDYFDTVWSVSGDDPAVDDAVVAQIGRLTQARMVLLQGSSVTDAGLAGLGGMRELRTIHLRAPNVNGSGFHHLSGLRRLENLHLYRTPITDEGLAHIAALTGIERLSFSGAGVSDAGMKHVAGLTSLKVLTIGPSGVGDDGLRELGRARRPMQVTVSRGTRITPEGIASVRSLAPEMTITP